MIHVQNHCTTYKLNGLNEIIVSYCCHNCCYELSYVSLELPFSINPRICVRMTSKLIAQKPKISPCYLAQSIYCALQYTMEYLLRFSC